ncbi:MAG: hypothetical protein ACYTGZ_14825 [Planctomycetota bacterium]|jgi:hypothetical protein
MKIHRSLPVLVTLASALECAALSLAMAMNRAVWLSVAMALHLAAAYIASRAAAVRRDDLSRTEPPPESERDDNADDEVINAHDMFERYEEHVTPHRPEYERTLFTGDYAADVARELDAESYVEVLRNGGTDQKRNALRRLATLGEAKHFAQIRGCLLDPSHEVRLYAYSELEKASQEFEDEIAELTKKLAKRPKNIASLMRLAEVQYRYAASGIHDEAMAAFYFKTVLRYARRAVEAGAEGPEPIWMCARAQASMGHPSVALAELAQLPEEQQGLPESCLVRAGIRFRAREFDLAREEAERVAAGGGKLPPWLAALRTEVEA